MQLHKAIGEQAIRDVIATHPRIGEILYQHEIGCVTCGVGICLLRDVVAIHALEADVEAEIETQINAYLAGAIDEAV